MSTNTTANTTPPRPQLDATVAKVLDRDRTAHEDSDAEDELIAELEAEDDALDAFREHRLQQLHDEFARAQAHRANSGSGTLEELHDEKAVMDVTTNNRNSLVHFFHSDFRRCKILDSHLTLLAPKHPECRFMRIEVEKAPFLVERLTVRVLPCLMMFIDGKQVGRIEGFERLGNTDTFRTVRLEEVLVDTGVFERVRFTEDGGMLGDGEMKEEGEENDSGDDWD